jgi:tetratricopeptide (TPR) repeat protein
VTDDVKPLADDSGAAGPTAGKARVGTNGGAPSGFGGQIRSVPTHDVAFASSIKNGVVPENLDLDEATGPVVPRRGGGGVGKWIAVGALVLIAGAAAAIYLVVIRPGGGGEQPAADPPVAAVDAGVTVPVAMADAQTQPVVEQGEEEAAVVAAREALRGDASATLEAAATLLAGGGPGSADIERLALRARIATAIAQHREDEALLAGDAKKAEKLRKESKQRVADALALAQKAKKTGAGKPGEAAALVAMADVLRLQGKPAQEVTANLTRATELDPGDREAAYVGALLALRDGETDRARQALQKLDAEAGDDVRPRFRLAMIAWKAGDAPAAQKGAEEVLAIQPEHGGAKKLLAKLGDTVAADPMPTEEPKDPKAKIDAGVPTTSGGGEPKGDYDSLLAKADGLAEDGNCGQAMTYYAKALEQKANGVGALTGRGYCYIDTKQFASAHSSFRAALAVSRRYEPALWGVGEAYQQQGLKEKAIEAYMRYLEAYPGTAKALKAIERLGGSVDQPPKEEPPKEEPPKEEPPAEDPGGGGGSDPGTPSE